MNKTIKYILISIAVFLGLMIIVMFFMMRNDTSMETQEEGMPSQVSSTTTPMQAVQTTNGYQDISIAGLSSMLGTKDFMLINVSVPNIGNIDKTDFSVPFNEIANNLDKFPTNKDAKIILYSKSGIMSMAAADTLSQLGYTHIRNLKGGIVQWQKDGNKISVKK